MRDYLIPAAVLILLSVILLATALTLANQKHSTDPVTKPFFTEAMYGALL